MGNFFRQMELGNITLTMENKRLENKLLKCVVSVNVCQFCLYCIY